MFEPVGRGQGMKCLVDHPFTGDEANTLVAWCESVGQAIREHAVTGVPEPG